MATINIAELLAVLRLADSMTPELRETVKGLKEVNTAVDTVQKRLDQMSGSVQRTAYQLTLLGRGMLEAGVLMTGGITVPILGAAKAVIDFGGEFEAAMTRVVTLGGATRQEVNAMRDDVLKMAVDTGVAGVDLAKGLYVLTSYGFSAAKSMEVLRTTADMAAMGMGNTTQTSIALTGALFAYKEQGLSAAEAGNILVKAVKYGNMEIQELIPAISKVNPLAASLGVKFEDVAASIAVFTRSGANASVAATGLRAMLSNIVNDSAKTEKGFKQLSGVLQDNTINMTNFVNSIRTKGLTEAMLDLIDKVNKADEAHKGLATTILNKIFPNVRALTEALAVYKINGQDVTEVLKLMKNGEDSLAIGTAELHKTWQWQWQQMQVQVQNLWIELGQSLLPIFKDLLNVFSAGLPIIRTVIEAFNELPRWIQGVVIGFIALFASIGPVLIISGQLIMAIGNIERGLLLIGAEKGAAGFLAFLRSPWLLGAGIVFVALSAAIIAFSHNIKQEAEDARAAADAHMAEYQKLKDLEVQINEVADTTHNFSEVKQGLLSIAPEYEAMLAREGASYDNLTRIIGHTVAEKIRLLETDRIALEASIKDLEQRRKFTSDLVEQQVTILRGGPTMLTGLGGEVSPAVGTSIETTRKAYEDARKELADYDKELENSRSKLSALKEILDPVYHAQQEAARAAAAQAAALKQARDQAASNIEINKDLLESVAALTEEQKKIIQGYKAQSLTASQIADQMIYHNQVEAGQVKNLSAVVGIYLRQLGDLGGAYKATTNTNKEFNDALADLMVQINSAIANHVPIDDIIVDLGSKIRKVGDESIRLGKEVPTAFAAIYNTMQSRDLSEMLKKLRQETEHIADLWQGQTKEAAEKMAAAWGKAIKEMTDDFVKFRISNEDSLLHGTDLELAQIERSRQAILGKYQWMLVFMPGVYALFAAEANKYYDHERDLALGTYDTIEERMRKLGVNTREDLEKTTANALRDYGQMQMSNQYTTDQMSHAWDRYWKAQQEAVGAWETDFLSGISKIAAAFLKLGYITTSSIAPLAKQIGGFLTALDLGAKSTDNFSKILGRMHDEWEVINDDTVRFQKGTGVTAEGIAGITTSIIEMIAAMETASTSSQNMWANIAMGAATGAAMGFKSGGPYAAIFGAVAGGIYAYAESGAAEEDIDWAAKAYEELGITLGKALENAVKRGLVTITYGLSETTRRLIQDSITSLTAAYPMAGNLIGIQLGAAKQQLTDAAYALNIGRIMQEAGTLNLDTLNDWAQEINKIFGQISFLDAQGNLRGVLFGLIGNQQAVASLEQSFPQLAEVAKKSTKLISEEFLKLLQNIRDLGLNVQAVIDFVKEQSGTIATGVERMLKPLTEKYGTLKDDIQKAQEAVDKLTAEGKVGTDEWTKAQDNLTELLIKQKGAAVFARGELERMGTVLMSTFNAALKQGMSWTEAVDAIGPGLDNIINLYDNLGISITGNVGLGTLVHYRNLVKENETLVDSVSALNETMVAMSSIGALDVESLAALEAQGVQSFEQLKIAGFTEQESLMMMRDWLNNVIDAHERLGTPIDENTQRLIDQAEQYGILEADGMSMQDILIEGFKAIIKAVGGEIPAAFEKMSKSAKDEAGKVSQALGQIPTDLNIGVHYEVENYPVPPGMTEENTPRPDEFHTGGIIDEVFRRGLVTMHGGGFVDHFSNLLRAHSGLAFDEIPIIAQEGEVMWSKDDVNRWGGSTVVDTMRRDTPTSVRTDPEELAKAIVKGMIQGGIGGGITFNATFTQAQKERYIREEVIPGILDVLKNGGSARTDFRVFLGIQ